MNIKTCYRYDEKTHEFLGADVAFQEPVEGTFPLPADCTFIEPPKTGEFEVPVFNGESWEVKPDYRKHIDNTGTYVGGKPFYNPLKYWWAEEEYTKEIGDKPTDKVWEKINKPEICNQVVELEKEVENAKQYLADTDYIHNVIAEEPEKAEKYASIITERKRIRATIDPKQAQADALKDEVADTYGEEALNHLQG